MKNICRNIWFSLASVATISACIFLFCLFFSIIANIRYMVKHVESTVGITVLFDENLTEQDIQGLGEIIHQRPEIREMYYISAEDAWNSFKEEYFAGHEELAEGFAEDNPLDASEEMCKLAEIHTGLEVLCMDYADMEFDDAFDGIWGNEALIHVPEDELPGILEKLTEALCQNGILFLSFQEGDFEGQRSGRYFCEYTREELERILTETGRLEILKLWTTEDEDREEGDKLLNVLAKKIS